MSWHCSPALVEEFSADTCSAGEPCAPLKSTPSVGRCYSDDRWMDSYRASLSGTTCKPLTASRGGGASMSSAVGSLARTFPPLGAGPGSRDHDPASGHTWHESSVRYDRDSSSWRTHRCLFDEDLPWSSATLPRWGLMRGGVCWELTMSERRTPGNGSGFWPTPKQRDWKDTGPTQGNRKSPDLGTMAHRKYPRPTTKANQMCTSMMDRGIACRNLRDALGGQQTRQTRPTPAASTGGPEPEGKTGRKLVTQAGGALNPNWVEWLMAWPIGWTDLEPLAMARFRSWRRLHGVFSGGQSDGASSDPGFLFKDGE